MKPVRFIRAWQTYSVGNVIYPTAAYGQTLVASGKCEYIEKKRKRGRPRKDDK